MPVDSEKLGDLLDRYWPVLVAWVGGARDEAEDIVQSAFIKLAAEDPTPINCAAWLFTVTKRLAINERLSRNKRRLREAQMVHCVSFNNKSRLHSDSVTSHRNRHCHNRPCIQARSH